jgi:hypothetical protein
MLTEIVVGGATSLVNLVIHAPLITAASHAVLGLSVRDTELPLYLQRVIVIVATGTLLVAGHLVEVMLWALTYEIVGGPAGHRPRLFRLRQLHDARLWRRDPSRGVAHSRPHDGAERHFADRLVHGADFSRFCAAPTPNGASARA